MMAFLYALLLGGFAAALGGGSSSSSASSAADDPLSDPGTGLGGSGDGGGGLGGSDTSGGGAGGGLGDGGSSVPVLPASAYDIGWAGLNAEEQLIVELVNRARMDPLGEVSRQSEALASGVSSTPVEALAVVPTLSNASEAHSEDMDDRDFFAHTNPDGDTPADRAIDAGHGSGFVGENIGWIGSTVAPDIQLRAEDHHANLWESDGHQQNLMNGSWSEVGVGYDYASYNGYDQSTFVTEMFGDRGETYLTGVVIEDADDDGFYDIGEGQGGVRVTAYDGDQAFGTATWEAGGYTLALPAGTYRVVFEGGDLDAPYETDVTIGNENVKLDVIDAGGSVVASAGLVPEGTPGLTEIAGLMLAPADEVVLPDPGDGEMDMLMLV